MRETSHFEEDVWVNSLTWLLGLACLWRILEIGTHMRISPADWVVAALIPVYVGYLEFLAWRRRAALADDWH